METLRQLKNAWVDPRGAPPSTGGGEVLDEGEEEKEKLSPLRGKADSTT